MDKCKKIIKPGVITLIIFPGSSSFRILDNILDKKKGIEIRCLGKLLKSKDGFISEVYLSNEKPNPETLTEQRLHKISELPKIILLRSNQKPNDGDYIAHSAYDLFETPPFETERPSISIGISLDPGIVHEIKEFFLSCSPRNIFEKLLNKFSFHRRHRILIDFEVDCLQESEFFKGKHIKDKIIAPILVGNQTFFSSREIKILKVALDVTSGDDEVIIFGH